MAQLYNTKVIYIDDYIRLDEVQIINYSPVLMFLSKLGSGEFVIFKKPLISFNRSIILPLIIIEDYPRLYNQLKDAHPNLHVYWKQDLPTRYHLKNNVRVTPIVAVAGKCCKQIFIDSYTQYWTIPLFSVLCRYSLGHINTTVWSHRARWSWLWPRWRRHARYLHCTWPEA